MPSRSAPTATCCTPGPSRARSAARRPTCPLVACGGCPTTSSCPTSPVRPIKPFFGMGQSNSALQISCRGDAPRRSVACAKSARAATTPPTRLPPSAWTAPNYSAPDASVNNDSRDLVFVNIASRALCLCAAELHKKTRVTKSHNVCDIEVTKDVVCKTHQVGNFLEISYS